MEAYGSSSDDSEEEDRVCADTPIAVVVHEAKCLPDMQWLGRMDPYAQAMTAPTRASQRRSRAAADGDIAPKWGAAEARTLMLRPAPEDVALRVELWNENLLKDDFIGAVTIRLDDLPSARTRRFWQLDSGGLLLLTVKVTPNLFAQLEGAKASGEYGPTAAMRSRPPRLLSVECLRARGLSNVQVMTSDFSVCSLLTHD